LKHKSVRGMDDILPFNIGVWHEIEQKARICLESYGYAEIRTPILEEASLFVRGIGETTDIVTKEMYTFNDRKGRSLTMRPEGTAPIVRSYIEHFLHQLSSELKLYYIGPMFRSERPQKGRSRQFHQIGAEIFGSYSPYADAELITQLQRMLVDFGLEGSVIKLNSLGSGEDKNRFAVLFRKYLADKENRLCQDCKDRINRNVLRVLDCKNECCRQVVREAPSILDSLSDASKANFNKLKDILKGMDIDVQETPNLVRGLDYYTGTVFEITHPALGAQDAIGAGGRYDNLVKDLGGAKVGAVGYAFGIERIIIALNKKAAQKKPVFIATLGDRAKIKGARLAEIIRKQVLFPVITDVNEVSLKSQMRNADRNHARAVLILGDNEIDKGIIMMRDMVTKEQREISEENIIEELKKGRME